MRALRLLSNGLLDSEYLENWTVFEFTQFAEGKISQNDIDINVRVREKLAAKAARKLERKEAKRVLKEFSVDPKFTAWKQIKSDKGLALVNAALITEDDCDACEVPYEDMWDWVEHRDEQDGK